MGQLWARHFSTVEICLHFSERVSTVTSFKDRLEYPDEGLWLPQQHWRQTQPRKWMCQITQCHPLGESCRCLCVCVCVLACVRVSRILFLPLWACCYLYFVSPSFLSSCISLISCRVFFVCLFFFSSSLTQKCNQSSSTSAAQRHDLPIFSFFYFASAIIWTAHSFPTI